MAPPLSPPPPKGGKEVKRCGCPYITEGKEAILDKKPELHHSRTIMLHSFLLIQTLAVVCGVHSVLGVTVLNLHASNCKILSPPLTVCCFSGEKAPQKHNC